MKGRTQRRSRAIAVQLEDGFSIGEYSSAMDLDVCNGGNQEFDSG